MRKGEKKKQDILDTAALLYVEKGYINTSIQDILDHLGCSKGSFYHHFKTKFEVLADIARERAKRAFSAYQAELPLNPPEALNHLLRQAGFLTGENLPLLLSLMDLRTEFDGAALLHVMQEAIAEAFYPSFVQVMNSLRKADLAVFLNEGSLRIAFHAFLSGCALLLYEADNRKEAKEQNDGLSLLRALRKHMEVSLGLNPGFVTIIEHSDLKALLDRLRTARNAPGAQ